MSESAEYNVWELMRARCYRPTNRAYPRYGGRGITICDRWRHDFAAFFADMGPRPSASHEIDRIDNDGPYAPGNCRWATCTTQSNNRRSNVRYEFNGRSLTIAEWSRETGLSVMTLHLRIRRRKWPVELALTLPPQKSRHWRL